MTIFSKKKYIFFFQKGLMILNQNSTIKLHFCSIKKWPKTCQEKINLQISKSGDKCQEKVVRQWDENKFTNFEIRRQMSREGNEAVRWK